MTDDQIIREAVARMDIREPEGEKTRAEILRQCLEDRDPGTRFAVMATAKRQAARLRQ